MVYEMTRKNVLEKLQLVGIAKKNGKFIQSQKVTLVTLAVCTRINVVAAIEVLLVKLVCPFPYFLILFNFLLLMHTDIFSYVHFHTRFPSCYRNKSFSTLIAV